MINEYRVRIDRLTPVVQTHLDALGWTPATLERHMGTADHTVYQILNGHRLWTLYLLWQVAEALGTTLHDLLQEASL